VRRRPVPARRGRPRRRRGRPGRRGAPVEIAAERASEADLRVGGLKRLPWPDRSFDVVTGLSSFQFADDPRRALDEAGRASRGLVVAAVPRASRSPTSAGLGPNADDEADSLTELEDADAAVRAFVGAGPTALAVRHSGREAVEPPCASAAARH